MTKCGLCTGITIDESAKKDFMEMMGWSEKDFEWYTYKIPNDK